MRQIGKHGIDGIKLLGAIVVAPIYRLFSKKDIYLIGERKDQCQDNGYHLFKYIRQNHPEDKFYYCITKDSSQLYKIKEMGNIVYYKTFKHYLYYVLARKLVCAHVGSCRPDTALVWKLEQKNILNKQKMFIQHGITKELIPSLMYKSTKANTFVCGAKPEYDFVKEHFGYPEGGVQYLGFCRFDNLHDFKTKKQVLVMPTWRQWFGMNGNNEMSSHEFIKSDYFKAYNELINSEKLYEILKQKQMKLIFYPHHEMQRYINYFKSKFDNIVVIREGDIDIQVLLKESEILITDYSSVAFDFAYMKKKIIYYQFDKEDYDNKHYKEGYFNYDIDGFGKVVDELGDLIDSLVEKSKSSEVFINNMNKFFLIDDKRNCQRTYEISIR